MKYRWNITAADDSVCAPLTAGAKISPLLARCLVNRGFSDPEMIVRFLQPRLKNLADPFLLPNMAAAVERLLTARAQGELVTIFGDYDVDGVTTTALLLETLRDLGWRVEHYLPHRMEEGYGLTLDGVKNCLERFPVKLLLAVDCGSTSCESIAYLNGQGIDVIVVDHHQVSQPAPAAFALVNPQLGADFHELCSVGLAFKVVHSLVKTMRERGIAAAAEFDLREHLDLVALGTIADLVPLRGENRIFVTAGMERLNASRRPGLLALRSIAQCAPILSAYEVAFQLAPRLNAAGRMQDAEAALQLLLAPDAASAEPIARELDQRNRERQAVERGICEKVIASLRERFDGAKDFVIVEGNAEWHIGVVGIVASRVLQEFYRPTIILGGDGAMLRGSGRSIEGFDLAAALRKCDELLTRHGGHAMAAGLTLSVEKVDLVRARLNDLVRQTVTAAQLQPVLIIDAEVPLTELTVERIEELAQLDPVGQANPAVRLAIRGLRHHQQPQRMGKDNQHAKLRVTDGRHMLEAVWWNCRENPLPSENFDLAVTAAINEFQGRRSVQLKVLDWRHITP